MTASLVPWVMVDLLFCLSLTLLRCSNFLRLSYTQGHFGIWAVGWMGLALMFMGVHFSQDHYSRLPTWLLVTQDGRGEAGTLFVNRQDGTGGFCGLPWGAKLCQLCPGLFHWARHLQVFGVLDVQTPSQSLVSGQDFFIGSLDHPTWVLGPFPVPFPLTKSS